MATTHSARNIGLADLPVADVMASPLNPRRTFDAESLQELANSIREHGLLEPIVVRQAPYSDAAAPYEIICGERRLRAAKLAGEDTITARILADVDDRRLIELALTENLQRRDIDPIEEAEGFRKLRELGHTQAAIAERLNRSQPYVANRERLLQLPDDVQERISKGELSPSHGVALLRYASFPAIVRQAAAAAVEQDLPSKRLEADFDALSNHLRGGDRLYARLGYGAAFDWKAKCREACPFGAYRAGSWTDMGYCLRPDHYDELQAEGEKREEARNAKSIERAKQATGDGKLPKLEKLPYDSYARIDSNPPCGCTEECPCRGAGLDREGKVVAICTDPKRHEKFKRAQAREEGKERRSKLDAQLAEILAALDGDDVNMLRRATALVVEYAIKQGRDSAQAKAAERLPSIFGDPVDKLVGILKQRAYERGTNALRDELAKLPWGRAVRLAAEIVVRQQFAESNDYHRDHMPAASYILGDGKAEFAPGDRVCALDLASQCWRYGTVVAFRPSGSPAAGDWLTVRPDEGEEFMVTAVRANVRFVSGSQQADPLAQQQQADGSDLEHCARCGEALPDDAFDVDGCGYQDFGRGAEVDELARDPRGHILTPNGAQYCAMCAPSVAICRSCGCTDEAGCPEGCSWVEPDLCSACAPAPATPADEELAILAAMANQWFDTVLDERIKAEQDAATTARMATEPTAQTEAAAQAASRRLAILVAERERRQAGKPAAEPAAPALAVHQVITGKYGAKYKILELQPERVRVQKLDNGHREWIPRAEAEKYAAGRGEAVPA